MLAAMRDGDHATGLGGDRGGEKEGDEKAMSCMFEAHTRTSHAGTAVINTIFGYSAWGPGLCAARFARRTGDKIAGVTNSGFSSRLRGGPPLIDRRQKTIVCPTGHVSVYNIW
ncbi:hypothetical protein SBA3_2320002 [Candidatus Sulfopaludibacter sp. SbA3]|nr:hypothetical protein SBA3_2320002 [Candidatus Sulfopaludibacter sp. SbA3]